MRSNIIDMKAVTLETMLRDLVASGSLSRYKESSETKAANFDQWRTQEFFFGEGVQQIQLRTEDREKGDLGAVTP
jgi:hypothetical protein